MIQTGDPTNTGGGGESIYSADFRDEFHSRLKFNHRGVVAMNNKNKPNSNGSQFFITLEKCEEMNKKFTIFGKVTGPTYFNAVNISNLTADEDGKPIMNNKDEIPKIVNTEVVINPFKDLKPTVDIETIEKRTKINNKAEDNNVKKKKKKKLKIKNITDKMFFDIDDDEENSPGIKLNVESNYELDCENKVWYKECSVNISHFNKNGTFDYHTYHLNHQGNQTISYEVSPLKINVIFKPKVEESETNVGLIVGIVFGIIFDFLLIIILIILGITTDGEIFEYL